MNDYLTAVNPRRLVVHFTQYGPDLSYGMIRVDVGIRPQLVHYGKIYSLPNPSRLQRISSFLRLKLRPSKKSKWVSQNNDRAIVDAHDFVSRHYQSGDQVVFLAEGAVKGDLIDTLEILARHLYNVTTPGKPPTVQRGGGNIAAGRRIPIYALAILGEWKEDVFEGMPWVHDELMSRFPPGIEHIIYYVRHNRTDWCCSTVRDLDGGIVWREITIYDEGDSHQARLRHATKDISYYTPWSIPDWDEQTPVWTKVLHSSPSGLPRNFPSSTLPAGIYQQELSRYQGGPEDNGRLVWTSFRD